MKKKQDNPAYSTAVSALRRIAGDELLQYKEGIDPEKLVKVLLRRLEIAQAQPQAQTAQSQTPGAKPATTQAQTAPVKLSSVTPIQGDLKLLDALFSPDTDPVLGKVDAAVISKAVDYRATVSVQKALAVMALNAMGESLNEEE